MSIKEREFSLPCFGDEPIRIWVRDVNGEQHTIGFDNIYEFNNTNWDGFDDDEMEILLVTIGTTLIYSQLQSGVRIYLEDLKGFFV